MAVGAEGAIVKNRFTPLRVQQTVWYSIVRFPQSLDSLRDRQDILNLEEVSEVPGIADKSLIEITDVFRRRGLVYEQTYLTVHQELGSYL